MIGEVKECVKHENADRLRVTKVDVGTGELVQIVCGAPNVRVGMKVPCAMAGAVLPPGPDGKPFLIKVGKLRGVESQGMLCSARELKLSEDHGGLMDLPADAPVGQNFRDYYQLNDLKFTIKLTPNKADCLSVLGVAREVSALTGTAMHLPEAHIGKVRVGQEVSVEVDAWKDEKFPGTVERIAPAVDPTTRRLQVRCKVDNKLLRLRPEMYARVSLLAEARRSAGRIPNAALVSDGLYSFVFIERETGVFEKRKVTLEVQDREFSYVSEGIKEGERVVVRGALLLASELASGS